MNRSVVVESTVDCAQDFTRLANLPVLVVRIGLCRKTSIMRFPNMLRKKESFRSLLRLLRISVRTIRPGKEWMRFVCNSQKIFTNLNFIKCNGVEQFNNQQSKRMRILKKFLAEFDDGWSKSSFV